ncbi:MAG: hypothetical protein FDZ75_01150, partial [Actinobacteria bacterium]
MNPSGSPNSSSASSVSTMPEEHDLLRSRIHALEETVRVLQNENTQLVDRAEDTLLLSIIAEEISAATDARDVLDRGLERISCLKDIPLCACFAVTEDDVRAISVYLNYTTDADRKLDVPLTHELRHLADGQRVYLDKDELRGLRPAAGWPGGRTPNGALVLARGTHEGARLVFLFADDSDDEHLGPLGIMLARTVDMLAARIDNLDLLSSLSAVNAELERTNEALRRATQAKSEFLATMSHEIRTPLSAILGYTQLLCNDPDITGRQREQLSTIAQSGELLLALLNDILDMSAIESGRVTVSPEDFELASLMLELETVFSGSASAKGLSLELILDGDAPETVNTDKAKVRQILANLLSNAIKFTQQGGIVVRARCTPSGQDRLRLHFDVEDTGMGIDAEEMGLLFDRFQQTSSGRELGTGTGLGLAISREYARQLGGDIDVHSELGAGSTFSVTIGARPTTHPPASEADHRSQVAAVPTAPAGLTALVADDYEALRLL